MLFLIEVVIQLYKDALNYNANVKKLKIKGIKMKRITSIILAVFASMTLFACGRSKCLHSEADWLIVIEPTCTTTGLKVLSCEKCGEKTEIIPATGHSWQNATCTTPKTCNNCNLTEGSALGHSYTSKVTKEATCTQQGIEVFTCAICNDSYTQDIEAKGHAYKQQSTGEDICSVCNDEAYATYSISALSKLYTTLKDPYSAVVSSIYAGKYKYDGYDCIIVVTSLKAKNSYGAMVSGEFVSLFYLETKKVIYDMEGYAQDQADYYERLADKAYGSSALEYLDKAIKYNKMVSDAITIRSRKTTLFERQELDHIVEVSKIIAGIS